MCPILSRDLVVEALFAPSNGPPQLHEDSPARYQTFSYIARYQKHFLMELPCLPLCRDKDVEFWTYFKRREMQEIVPRLFLGPYSSASKNKLPELQKLGTTHVICIRQSLEAKFIQPNFPQFLKYLVLDVEDNPAENIMDFLPASKEFTDGSLQAGGKVFVHGNAGLSRSAALVIAYRMETFRMTFNDAFLHVKGRRYCICPNDGFIHQLREYEAINLAKLTAQISPPEQGRSLSFLSGNSGNLKGRHEEEEEFGNKRMTVE
ncbi:serine/threonine/tyrosine-interacting protein-like [Monodelphis domestica]|uniref:serine/threonine/tyrosine-interacting protein-like n=1 Tax=Monodelphis domestica TaxID=13616 RepID=UPI0024E245C3|nr:serine/threonine/tyrosine-interacting protein-like [Monodelphis domestica]